MISIRYLISGTPTIRARMVHPPSTPTMITEADVAPLERGIRGSGSVDGVRGDGD